jgi:hypothetical protein
MDQLPLPRILSFVICENTIEDRANRISIINIFNRIYFENLPATAAFRVYLSAILPEGNHKINITLESPDSTTTSYAQAEIMLLLQDKIDLVAIITNNFTEYNSYFIHAFDNDKIIATQELAVQKPSKEQPQEPQ